MTNKSRETAAALEDAEVTTTSVRQHDANRPTSVESRGGREKGRRVEVS